MDPLVYSGVMFAISSKILEMIFLNPDYFQIFSSAKSRYRLFDEWLFHKTGPQILSDLIRQADFKSG
jgi:hypothetical protein